VDTGDTVSYRVVQVIRNAVGKLELLETQASDRSPAKALGARGEGAADARQRDENEKTRERLLTKGVNISERDRFISRGALGHNKFMIRTDADEHPLSAWTGSTNWTPTGLCTQLNNRLLIEDTAVAKVFFDQWHALKDAQSRFPETFIANNSKAKPAGQDMPLSVRRTVWCSRTRQGWT
jgi:hypothetical protein